MQRCLARRAPFCDGYLPVCSIVFISSDDSSFKYGIGNPVPGLHFYPGITVFPIMETFSIRDYGIEKGSGFWIPGLDSLVKQLIDDELQGAARVLLYSAYTCLAIMYFVQLWLVASTNWRWHIVFKYIMTYCWCLLMHSTLKLSYRRTATVLLELLLVECC